MYKRYFFPISVLFGFLLPIPSVQAQLSPWQLFGQICQFTSPNSPQCQQLLIQQQLTAAQQAALQQQLQQQKAQQVFLPFNPTPFQTIPTIISLPIANAGVSQTVSSGASVTLNGAGSTGSVSILNGVQTQATIVSYAWTQVSGTTVSLNGANTVTPTFIAPTNTTTILSFSLIVTDSIGQVSAPATTSVSVQ
jgi:hypothetical protein